MEITLKETVAKIKLDLTKFKKLLKASLDIEKAVKQSIIEVESEQLDPDEVIDFIYSSMQWGKILEVLPHRKDTKFINFILFEMCYKDWTKYESDKAYANAILISERKEDGKGLFLIQDIISNYGFNVKNFFATQGFVHHEGWNKEVEE